MEKPSAHLNFSLFVECPKCKKDFDLIRKNDNDNDISTKLFGPEWVKLQGWEVVCDYCDHEFKIKEVVY